MALLLTLGFLCVMLMLVLSLALASRTERRVAAAGADLVRSQLVARSALGEAEARLRLDYQGVRYPADRFYTPSESSSWAGRRYLASGGSALESSGVGAALAVRLNGRVFTPETALSDRAGWIPMLSQQTVHTPNGLVNQNVVVGRYAYLVIDESGMIDPAAVVRTGVTETTTETMAGVSLAEISLAALGFSNPDRFLPETPFEDLLSGQLPANEGRWFSRLHMARALNFTQGEMDHAARSLFPFSLDQEQFWRDRNDNGVYDSGEEADRLDIRSSAELSKVYQTLVGPLQSFTESGVNAGMDDCSWLRELDGNPWFTGWKNNAFAGYSEPERSNRARSVVAAQVAANIVDYADPDSEPTVCHVDDDGQIRIGMGNTPFNLTGIERTWALSQVALRVEADVTEQSTSTTNSTGDEVATASDIPFEIYHGTVIPHERFVATVTILGTNIVAYDTTVSPPVFLYTAPIATSVELGGVTLSPWGSIDDPVGGNINDGKNPRHYEVPAGFPAGTPISLNAKYWRHPVAPNGKIDYKTWELAETLGTDSTPARVHVLRKGDSVPYRIAQDAARGTLVYYLQEYVEDGKISVQPNQAICLFETLAFASPRIPDYQDLVLLITMRPADEQPTVNNRTVRFALAGSCNLNPNNNDRHEFYLQTPDGTTITRDDLQSKETSNGNRNPYYEGKVTYLRIMPKGNANQNTVTLNGVTYTLRNGHVYDFWPDPAAEVYLWNDRYDSNGRAMGHWWIDFNGWGNTAVFEDGNLHYVLAETSTADDTGTTTTTGGTTSSDIVSPDQQQAVSTDYGNRLRVRVGFQAELYYPWCADAQLLYKPASVDITYKVVVGTATGRELVSMGTKRVAVDGAANVDGGTVIWTSDFDMDTWVTLDDAFDTLAELPLLGYTVTQARIMQVVIRDHLGAPVDVVPNGPGDLYAFAAANQAVNDASFYGGLTAHDAFMNDRGHTAPDFALFWGVTPADGLLADTAFEVCAGMGTLSETYGSGSYAGICVPNSLIQRLGELGRVHSYMPNRSLRLWAASSSDERGHDADLLDVFKIGPQATVSGRININTRQPAVLTALLTGALPGDVDAAVSAILARRSEGLVFNTIGEFLGGVSALYNGTIPNDAVAEDVAVRLAEKITTRSNYFTVIVCAQAVKDIAGLPFRNAAGRTVNAAYGNLDVTGDGKLLDPVLAERKLMAVVYRDALTATTKIERLEYLDE